VCRKYQKTPFSLAKSAVSAELRVLCFVLLPPLRCFVLKFGSEMCFSCFAVAANSHQLRRRRRRRLLFSPFHLPTTPSVL
jgi:hypothetical protein